MEIISKGRYTITSYDKFEDLTITEWYSPEVDHIIGEFNWKRNKPGIIETFDLVLRLNKDFESEDLVLDYFWSGEDLFFFNSGKLIINCDDSENVVLLADDEDTRQRTDLGWEMEGLYDITKKDLVTISKASKIEIRVSEERHHFILEGNGLLKFQLMCRAFLSEVYNDKSYDDWLNSILR
jgi:hypothetical protein